METSEPQVVTNLRMVEKSPGVFMVRGPGPVAWCKRCGRKHRRGENCGLEEVTRTAKSGKKVKRLAHPKPRAKAKTKTKARKS